MVRRGPAAAANLVATSIAERDGPRSLRAALEDVLVTEGWASSAAEVAETAESLEIRVRRRLEAHLEAAIGGGSHLNYEFNSSSTSMIQGSCFIEPSDSLELRAAKNRRASTSDYFSVFESLTHQRFEELCVGVLRLLGVQKPGITPATADEGIDFYGEITPLATPTPLSNFQDHMRVWLIGQAKHYPSGQAATPEIRELVGSVDLARAKAFSRTSDPYAELTIRVCDPIYYLFVTTGSISSAGWRLLDKSGVVGIDRSRLATFLADRKVGQISGSLDDAEFQLWLDTPESDSA